MIIHVGITRIMDEATGKEMLVGDVAFEECQHAKANTPVPGGVGPMTIFCLLAYTVQVAECMATGNGDCESDYHDAPDRSMHTSVT